MKICDQGLESPGVSHRKPKTVFGLDKAAIFKKIDYYASGNNSVVECNLAKVEVAGSNPVSRSIFLGRHSQVVRQRSAKPLFSGSNPDAASIFSLHLSLVSI